MTSLGALTPVFRFDFATRRTMLSALSLLALFVVGCGGGASVATVDDPSTTGVKWFLSQVVDDGYGIEGIAVYGGCDRHRLNVRASESPQSVRVIVSADLGRSREREGVEIVCDAAHTERFSVRLRKRLNGRTVTGPGEAAGGFTDVLQNSRTEDYLKIPNVVGMEASQAVETLCRWGLGSAVPRSADGSRVVGQRPVSGSSRPRLGAQSERKYVDAIGRSCEQPPRAGTSVALAISGS